ncbi:hypothetical protein BGX33_011440 [Mortierella sp. NVP41]|nr:hypothetical protein BGX33_011440 [Mortierella sp. NVP41]
MFVVADEIKILKSETDIHKSLKHPHIVKILDDFQVEDLKIIALELCRGGDLDKKLAQSWRETSKKGLPEKDIARWAAQVLDGFEYLHYVKGLVHRNIKPHNVLVDKKNGVKVVDFGFASTRKTNGYRAPEINGRTAYGREVDVYAFYAIIHLIIHGLKDERGELAPTDLEGISSAAMEVKRGALKLDQREKLTFAKLATYEFFSGWWREEEGEKRPLGRDNEDVEHASKRMAVGPSTDNHSDKSPQPLAQIPPVQEKPGFNTTPPTSDKSKASAAMSAASSSADQPTPPGPAINASAT